MSGERATAVWFGPADAKLFGWYHAPQGPLRDRAVVIASPIGYDWFPAFRPIRVLAEQLAAMGFAVLRYDHAGTGDSSGDTRAAGLVAQWLAGYGHASDLVRVRSGCAKVSLIGLRLSALLAVAAAQGRPEIDELVLWLAPPTGRHFLRELRALWMLKLARERKVAPEGMPGGFDAFGFTLGADAVTELSQISAKSLSRSTGRRALLLGRDDQAEDPSWGLKLRELGVEVDERRLPGSAEFLTDSLMSVVPPGHLEAITGWLGGAPTVEEPRPAVPPEAGPGETFHEFPIGGVRVREELVRFGPQERLVGILTEQVLAPPGTANGPCLILLNTGVDPRIGPNRLWTEMARRLAAPGGAVLRMDLGGLGDSEPAPGTPEGLSYPRLAVSEVREAMTLLHTRKPGRRVAVGGICSGAYYAVRAALEGVEFDDAIAINLNVFWHGAYAADPKEVERRGTAFDLRPEGHDPAGTGLTGHEAGRLWNLDNWRRLFSGERNLGRAVRLAVRRIRTLARGTKSTLLAPLGLGHEMARGFTSITGRGVRLHLVYSEFDVGHSFVQLHCSRELEELARLGRADLRIVLGADHTFSFESTRQELERGIQAVLEGMK